MSNLLAQLIAPERPFLFGFVRILFHFGLFRVYLDVFLTGDYRIVSVQMMAARTHFSDVSLCLPADGTSQVSNSSLY
jgi:hypothetical protein